MKNEKKEGDFSKGRLNDICSEALFKMHIAGISGGKGLRDASSRFSNQQLILSQSDSLKSFSPYQ